MGIFKDFLNSVADVNVLNRSILVVARHGAQRQQPHTHTHTHTHIKAAFERTLTAGPIGEHYKVLSAIEIIHETYHFVHLSWPFVMPTIS